MSDTATTYDECLDAIESAQYDSTKLGFIALLPGLRGNNNPNYEKGLQLIAKQTSAIVKQSLTSEIYTFVVVGNSADYDPFNYVLDGYIAGNPGMVGNSYKSYVGVYYNEYGENT